MDVRRELGHINNHFRRHKEVAGLTVVWYEFVPLGSASVNSVYDDVYDEGIRGAGGKKYKPGVVLPVLLASENEDERRAIADGRKPTQTMSLFIPMKGMKDAGLYQPWEYQNHLNDMFVYDGRFYNIYSYKVRGVIKDEVFVLVDGYETFVGEELVNDPGPGTLGVDVYPWPSSLPSL
jgi:hypothetical protein